MNIITSKINRILNLQSNEWPRVSIAWSINFFYRISFLIGWTILVSMFVSRLGIKYLPILFIINATLIIFSTSIYAEIISRVKNESLIIITTLTAGIILYLSTFFSQLNDNLFFAIILIAFSVILSQIGILISIFTENLFSPLESQRTFPIIESAETIGGIAAGAILGVFANSIPTFKFIYIWILALYVIIPIIMFFLSYAKKIPYIKFKKNHHPKHSLTLGEFQNTAQKVKKSRFLKGLLILVISQWIFINLLEFQYTKAINDNLTKNHSQSINIETQNDQNTPNFKKAHPVKTHESDLTRDLGRLTIIFSFAALFVQLLLASRVIKKLGIIGSMFLYPIILFGNILWMTLNFGFSSAVTTRLNYELVAIIQKNSYHSSYYVLGHELREEAKEFLEGFGKPLGAIFGMIFILILQNSFGQEQTTLYTSILMVFILGIIFTNLFQLKQAYTEAAKTNLKNPGNRSSKFNSIEILGQKGHKNPGKFLTDLLYKNDESDEIKTKILKILGEIQDYTTTSDILEFINHENLKIRKTALESLNQFNDLGEKIFKQAFSRHRAISTLKKLFYEEKNDDLRNLTIKILAKFNITDIAEFILKTLNNTSNNEIKAQCIYACGLFHDPNTAHYLLPYLNSKNPKLKANTIIALWQFPRFKTKLKEEINKILESKNEETIKEGIRILGEIKMDKFNEILIKYLQQKEKPTLRIESSISLSKLGNPAALDAIISLIFGKDEQIREKIKDAIENFPHEIQKKLHIIANQNVCNHINQLINESEKTSLEELPIKTLNKLKKAYLLIDAETEMLKVEDMLKLKKLKIPLSA